MSHDLRNVIGKRGESIAELCLTDFEDFPRPLFRPGFLGDKWPAIDLYVELTGVQNERPYFFCQIKSTAAEFPHDASHLKISSKSHDVRRLLEVPGPTYILGIHEPSKRVFARSIHQGMSGRAVSSISVENELTSMNLQKLHDEVRDFWQKNSNKPHSSAFL